MYRRQTRMFSTASGSITVFLSLMLMLVGSLLLTLLESSRYFALGMMATITSQSVSESIFAEYNIPAFEQYHLLMLDGGYGTKKLSLSKINAKMQTLGQENLNPVVTGLGRYSDFLQMDVTDAHVVHYELLADQNGGPLIDQIVEIMKKEAVLDLTEEALNRINGTKRSLKQGKNAELYMDQALDRIEEERQQAEEKEALHQSFKIKTSPISIRVKDECLEKSLLGRKLTYNQKIINPLLLDTSLQQVPSQEQELVENPIEDVKEVQKGPMLFQILDSGTSISSKRLENQERADRREKNAGNYELIHSISLTDKLLLVQYLKKYCSNYLHNLDNNHYLNYEQEFLLFGRNSDAENLEKMAQTLVLLREGINFTYLMTDAAKKEEAYALALSIATAMGIPAAAHAIQMGLLASWAYAESVAEIRTLFNGGKIAVIKSSSNWTVSLGEMTTALFDTSRRAKETAEGMDYEDFLQSFLYVENSTNLGMRLPTLIERNLRLYKDYEQIQVDCMITAMEIEYNYKARQAFLTPASIEKVFKKGYGFHRVDSFSYLQEN